MRPLNIDKKRKHHYVWKYYLQAWSKDEQIYCLRNGKIFQSNLTGVANVRDFYRLQELTDKDISLIKALLIDPLPDFMREDHMRMIKGYQRVFAFKRAYELNGKPDKNIDEGLDIMINNLEEEVHQKIEVEAIPLLNKLRFGDTSFFKADEGRAKFLHYMAVQHVRTKKIRDELVRRLGDISEVNIERIQPIMGHIIAINATFFMGIEKTYHLVLLKNKSTHPFVAGDQPIYNTKTTPDDQVEAPKELEWYYPLSPDLALLLTNQKEYIGVDEIDLEEGSILQYNKTLYFHSNKHVYSNSPVVLEWLKNSSDL